jgi:hypothetical protein
MDLTTFLRRLDAFRISYRLDRVRDATMVVVAVPGERWEVEFMDEGGVEVEMFRSDGTMADASALGALFATEEPGS